MGGAVTTEYGANISRGDGVPSVVILLGKDDMPVGVEVDGAEVHGVTGFRVYHDIADLTEVTLSIRGRVSTRRKRRKPPTKRSSETNRE